MASNPRKFSEKIALHNQKQAEETAAFEQIMKEVGSAKTPRNGECSPSHSHLGIGTISSFRAGSLPNVNSPSTNTAASIDLQSALNNLEDMRAGREAGYHDRRSAGPGGGAYTPGASLGSVRGSRRIDPNPQSHSYHMHPASNMGPPMVAGSMGSNMAAGSIGATSVAYLSPPLDSSWRRTHSDSALHQASTASNEILLHGSVSPNFSRKGHDGMNYHNIDPNISGITDGLGVPIDNRPKSCCDVSRVPGINICPGPEPNGIQIPIGNNTGSLPDLTNLQFASPLPNPVDFDDTSLHTHNLYSTSPNLGSPHLGGGLNSMHPLDAVGVGLNPSARGSSPGPSPSLRRRPHHQLQNLVLGSSPRSHHGHLIQNHSQNVSPGIALDSNGISMPNYQSFLYQNSGQCQSGSGEYGQPVSPAHSPTPTMISSSQPIPTGNMNYRSSSPGEGNCANSAPPSPVSQSLSPASSPGLAQSPASPFTDQTANVNGHNQISASSGGNPNQVSFYHNQANVLNHQFEQFTMMDTNSDQTLSNYGNYKNDQFGQVLLPFFF